MTDWQISFPGEYLMGLAPLLRSTVAGGGAVPSLLVVAAKGGIRLVGGSPDGAWFSVFIPSDIPDQWCDQRWDANVVQQVAMFAKSRSEIFVTCRDDVVQIALENSAYSVTAQTVEHHTKRDVSPMADKEIVAEADVSAASLVHAVTGASTSADKEHCNPSIGMAIDIRKPHGMRVIGVSRSSLSVVGVVGRFRGEGRCMVPVASMVAMARILNSQKKTESRVRVRYAKDGFSFSSEHFAFGVCGRQFLPTKFERILKIADKQFVTQASCEFVSADMVNALRASCKACQKGFEMVSFCPTDDGIDVKAPAEAPSIVTAIPGTWTGSLQSPIKVLATDLRDTLIRARYKKVSLHFPTRNVDPSMHKVTTSESDRFIYIGVNGYDGERG